MRATPSTRVSYSFGPEAVPTHFDCLAADQDSAAVGRECTPQQHDRMPSDIGLGLGLQFCRANMMSLARLQIALKTNDRQCALEVMDRFHELDSRIEQLVQRLPPSAEDMAEWEEINKHLGEQKMAMAFEKLVFASGFQGPALVSQPVVIPGGEDDKIRSLAWPKPRDIETYEAGEFPWDKAGALFLAILIFVTLIGFIGFVTSP